MHHLQQKPRLSGLFASFYYPERRPIKQNWISLGFHKQYLSAIWQSNFYLIIQSSTNITVASNSYNFIDTKIIIHKGLLNRTKIGNSIVTLSSSIIHHVKHLCLNFKLSFWHLFDTRNMVILCGSWFDHWRTRWIILLNLQLFCQLRLRFLYKLSLNCWYIFVDKYIVRYSSFHIIRDSFPKSSIVVQFIRWTQLCTILLPNYYVLLNITLCLFKVYAIRIQYDT